MTIAQYIDAGEKLRPLCRQIMGRVMLMRLLSRLVAQVEFEVDNG